MRIMQDAIQVRSWFEGGINDLHGNKIMAFILSLNKIRKEKSWPCSGHMEDDEPNAGKLW